ncbi:hypothetical protein C8Q78DRAFT_187840 [Trametes maxima]|nr:hypothetical protein C8Q78DRAFT_187840 [Trametes maxima]
MCRPLAFCRVPASYSTYPTYSSAPPAMSNTGRHPQAHQQTLHGPAPRRQQQGGRVSQTQGRGRPTNPGAVVHRPPYPEPPYDDGDDDNDNDYPDPDEDGEYPPEWPAGEWPPTHPPSHPLPHPPTHPSARPPTHPAGHPAARPPVHHPNKPTHPAQTAQPHPAVAAQQTAQFYGTPGTVGSIYPGAQQGYAYPYGYGYATGGQLRGVAPGEYMGSMNTGYGY